MEAADAALQTTIETNATLSSSDAAGLLAMITANANADETESQEGDVADAAIQADVDANKIDSDDADDVLQGLIEGNANDITQQGSDLQGAIADNAVADQIDADETDTDIEDLQGQITYNKICLLYTSPSPRDS